MNVGNQYLVGIAGAHGSGQMGVIGDQNSYAQDFLNAGHNFFVQADPPDESSRFVDIPSFDEHIENIAGYTLT